MKLGKRSLKQILKAVLAPQHYIALWRSLVVYQHPWDGIKRYFFAKGTYPIDLPIKTPTGLISPKLYWHYDMLTVNEVFCRKDYQADKEIKVVVDLGSNIGLSALYFLTRNTASYCYLFEPDPENIQKLRHNLATFSDRYSLQTCAVASKSGTRKFGREPTGRYGSFYRKSDDGYPSHLS